MRTFFSGSGGKPTDLLNYATKLSLNESQSNRDLFSGMLNDEHKKLLQDYFFNEKSFSITTVAGQESYNLPYNYSKLKTGTLTIGNLRWNPTEILSRRDWDNLKTIVNYQSDIPNNFFIYNGKFNLWPVPSTTGNTITFNYKIRVPDLNITDYTAGTVTVTDTKGVNAFNQLYGGASGYTTAVGVATTGGTGTGCIVNTTCVNGVVTSIVINAIGAGYEIGDTLKIAGGDGTASFYVSDITQSATVTGAGGTAWKTTVNGGNAGNVMNLNLWIRLTAPQGDGNWYQIQSIETDTSLTLVNPYQGGATTAAPYTIGQMPLLLEDFQDIPVFQALVYYFSTIAPNQVKAAEFKEARDRGIKMMDVYVGSKSLNVNLAQPRVGENPNLFSQSFGQLP